RYFGCTTAGGMAVRLKVLIAAAVCTKAGKIIPEYCRTMEESEIADNAFNLIFAFDEIVALGYRESVNLAQIRTFVEMDSHEEKVYQAVRQTQEREAKNKMREKAKELQRQRMEANKKGVKSPGFNAGGFGSNTGYSPAPVVGDSASVPADNKPSFTAIQKPMGTTKAMKLGSKSRDVESFVDQLKSEGENVVTPAVARTAPVAKVPVASENTEDIHLRQEEHLTLRVGRDGGLQNFELHGLVTLRIADEKWGRIRVQLDNKDRRGIQLQLPPVVGQRTSKRRHIPNVDTSNHSLLHTDVGVLNWRYQHSEREQCSSIARKINCWPSENGQGGCDVNIEYELEHEHMELNDVCITIPLCREMGSSPVVNECDGEYIHDSRKNVLLWTLPIIDINNKSGSLEFSATAMPGDFFPLHINFVSKKSYADLAVTQVVLVDDDSPVKYSVETVFFTEKYEIV
ncbi:hypothetical protein L9F63_012847, partial [Diploptera punctata]